MRVANAGLVAGAAYCGRCNSGLQSARDGVSFRKNWRPARRGLVCSLGYWGARNALEAEISGPWRRTALQFGAHLSDPFHVPAACRLRGKRHHHPVITTHRGLVVTFAHQPGVPMPVARLRAKGSQPRPCCRIWKPVGPPIAPKVPPANARDPWDNPWDWVRGAAPMVV